MAEVLCYSLGSSMKQHTSSAVCSKQACASRFSWAQELAQSLVPSAETAMPEGSWDRQSLGIP